MLRFRVSILFIFSIFLSNLICAQAPTFGNTGPISICINGSYYLNPSTTEVTFSSLSSTIATVNSSGYVTGIAIGTTEVSLTTDGGTVTASVTVGSTSSITITDPNLQPNYKFVINTPQGPVDGTINYIGYNGFTYSSQTRPTNRGYYRASKQDGNEAGCPVQFYIIKCDACVTVSESYSSVTIGSQVWTDKNLEVTTYRNGDVIPEVTNPAAWANLTTGAWCYYNNDPANGAIYGKLYNWYAVNDPRGLAPQGWHVPTDAEWTTLGTSLGGNSVAGGKMKTTGNTRWTSPNTNASNESGFTGLPSGYRVGGLGTSGAFESLGNGITLWSATESNATSSIYRFIDFNSEALGSWELNKAFGFSVRLIKD